MSSVTIVGLGTIGSVITQLVARMPGISHMVLVDPDRYDESNISTQNIDKSAPGNLKVEIQAAQIYAINPQIRVTRFSEPIENVPLQQLRSSVILSCVDSRSARQSINRIAWRCGKPWLDAAINTPSLVRLNAYHPARFTSCLECSWDQKSYDLLEQAYPCNPLNLPVAATNAPAELGALAAVLQAAELRKLLNDDISGSTLDCAQLMFDTATHEKHLLHFEVNEQCRFDHQSWCISQPGIDPQVSTMADLFDSLDSHTEPAISLEGHSFATHLDCIACGRRSCIGLSLYRRLSKKVRTCSCGGYMFSTGYFSFESISRSDLSPSNLQLKLAVLGLRAGDVITVDDASGNSHHVEIGTLQHNE
jgi:molybdopterin/thiamine biosynthesis adenylyltransferase